MADILKEMLKYLPSQKISDAVFEAANIVIYTRDIDFFLDNKGAVKALVDQFKKRVELRVDPSLIVDKEEAEKRIRNIIPEEAGVQELIFDEPRSRVIIHTDKPGLAIGKQGSILREIRKETHWVPLMKRMPPIRSRLIENIRSVLYENAGYRRKFLDKVGHRIYDGWVRERKSEWVRVTCLGASRQIGRSCFLVQTPESRIMIDCGIDVTGQYDSDMYPFLDAPEFKIEDLDAVILTHAHIDHCGFIPYLFKYGYRGPVYCTAPTRDISALIQLDFVKIQRAEGRDPIYTSEEIKQTILHTITLNLEEVTDITPDFRITLYNAGHMMGSSIIHMNIGNGMHNLVYTGDLKYGSTYLMEPAVNRFPRMETLIIESTYGGRDNVSSRSDPEEDTARTIIETLSGGGKILMPVLGSGRAQEVMLIIEKLAREKRIPDIPVYIDGMVWDIAAIHTAYPEYLNRQVRTQIFHKDSNPFLSPIFKRIGSQRERMQVIEEEGACIILATSGMLTGGPSVEYFKNLAGSSKNMLIFSCYQGPGCLGRRIMNGERDFIFKESGKNRMVKMNMQTSRLDIGGHSDRRELMNYVARAQPQPKKIIVVHGEVSKSIDLASSYHKVFRVETIVPRNLESIRIR